MRKIIYITVLGIATSFLSCKNSSGQSNDNGLVGQINASISIDEFENKLSPSVQLIDVRTPDEFKQGHLTNALNYNVNSDDFENEISKLDKTKPVLVYCLSGGRSAGAAEFLSEKGFTTVYNMQGGIMKWSAANKPLELGAGSPSPKGLSLEDFNKLINSHDLVLVDYNAKWCKPCKKMAPMLAEFVAKRKDKLTLIKIDADENKSLLYENKIEAVPVLELYKAGKLVWKHEGEIDEETLTRETKL